MSSISCLAQPASYESFSRDWRFSAKENLKSRMRPTGNEAVPWRLREQLELQFETQHETSYKGTFLNYGLWSLLPKDCSKPIYGTVVDKQYFTVSRYAKHAICLRYYASPSQLPKKAFPDIYDSLQKRTRSAADWKQRVITWRFLEQLELQLSELNSIIFAKYCGSKVINYFWLWLSLL